MTPRPNRVRRVMKWTGLVGCVVLAIAWGISLFVRQPPAVSAERPIAIARGGVFAGRVAGHGYYVVPNSTSQTVAVLRTLWPIYLTTGVKSDWLIFIPFWIPLILLAIPTYILWRRDRRKPEGCCQQCGYDLTGNETGVCSECGTNR